MTQTTPAIQAAQSAGRAAGYCWMRHPSGSAHCTRPPHGDGQHESYYVGRISADATTGVKWQA
jgi:hypothetical protein